MNKEQEEKLKMVVKLIDSGMMKIPTSTTDLVEVVRSVLNQSKEELPKIGNPGMEVVKRVFIEKCVSTVICSIEKDDWWYMSKVRCTLNRKKYFNDAVKSEVLGTNCSAKVFDFVIRQMELDGIIEVFGNKVSLKQSN